MIFLALIPVAITADALHLAGDLLNKIVTSAVTKGWVQ